MKIRKFISMLMATSMAASIVPSTALAAEIEKISQIKTVGEIEWNVDEAKAKPLINGVELQIKLQDFYQSYKNSNEEFELELDFNGAEITTSSNVDKLLDNSGVYRDGVKIGTATVKSYEAEDKSLSFVITEDGYNFTEDDKVIIVLDNFKMDNYSKGSAATIDVSGDFGEATEVPFAAVFGNTLVLNYSSKLTEIAKEDIKELKTITIESKVGKFTANDEIKVKVNDDFEIVDFGNIIGGTYKLNSLEENEFVIAADGSADEITISKMVIEALDSAKSGETAKLEVKCKNYDSDVVEVAKVIDSDVEVTVDEDVDIPVIYSGTDSEYKNLDCSDDHNALTVTIEETTVDSWSTKDKWSLKLPEGVYVTDKSEFKAYNTNITNENAFFSSAYADSKKGNFEGFEFGRRSFEVTDKEKAKFEITLNLVAEPSFEGDVDLTFDNGEFTKTVTIAKFVKPYNVKIEQNDVKIDYRYTKLDSGILITEPEEGLWEKGAEFNFQIERDINFEKGETYEANFEVKGDADSAVGFIVKEQSDEEPFKVTINNLTTYMNRNLPAGGYDLIVKTSFNEELMKENILGTNKTYEDICDIDNWDERFENFVNIITGDDDTFTTKVVVPVGENYIMAEDKVINIDTPAYINAEGYTMLPVRAVSLAFGIDNDAIVWNDTAKTVTIFYGSRIITMTVGSNVMTVNGTVIPTSSTVEVTNGRMFIPMRDLATALGAKSLNWDNVNKIATIN